MVLTNHPFLEVLIYVEQPIPFPALDFSKRDAGAGRYDRSDIRFVKSLYFFPGMLFK